MRLLAFPKSCDDLCAVQSALLLGGLDAAECAPQREVVANLHAGADDERQEHRVAGHDEAGEAWRHRPGGDTHERRDTGDHRALAWIDDREHVRLTRGY